jgi:hypothetical protein
MKYIILLIFLAAFQGKEPQPGNINPATPSMDTIPIKDTMHYIATDTCRPGLYIHGNSYRGFESDSLCVRVLIFDTGKIVIKGDTISAIKMMLNFIDQGNKRESEYLGIIGASVQFTNTVGDSFKTGPKWNAYVKELKKLGYTVKKKK